MMQLPSEELSKGGHFKDNRGSFMVPDSVALERISDLQISRVFAVLAKGN